MPSPNDHVKSIVELLRPATPDLARRWLAALLLVPASQREEIVSTVERQLASAFPLPAPARPRRDDQAPHTPPPADTRLINVAHPAIGKDGYTERRITTYEILTSAAKAPAKTPKPRAAKPSTAKSKPRRA